MEWFEYILQLPLTQVIGVLVVIAIAEQMGMPVIAFIKKALKLNGGSSGSYELMKELKHHYNDETTELLKGIKGNLETHHELEQQTLRLLEEFKEYGIPCRSSK